MKDNKRLTVDNQRRQASVSLDGPPKVLIVGEGKTRLIELPDHGELIVKTHDSKITIFDVSEKHLF